MAELHEALTFLAPTEWDDVPTDSLSPYLQQIFSAGELICNSVPPPVDGTPFAEAKPEFSTPNTATSWQETHASPARQYPASAEHTDLQKNWGKAMKFSAKDNPLNVAVYKMAGKDRHGAWFARRSVHEGMGFAKFKKAMLREFPESLACQGGPGDGNVRGIGGDQRLERQDAEGVGRMEVYQLSAQFPGPTTPREFITLLLTSDNALSEKSAAELDDGKKHIPRSHMIVSKPISHPDAPTRSGYIRGQYESVELIREIPLSEASGSDPELNPVEWIMITRSDPGGGIPRFMVDRGTPSAMIGDIHKWLDWATKVDPEQDAEDAQPVLKETDGQAPASAATNHAKADSGVANMKRASPQPTTTDPGLPPAHEQNDGVASHLTQALEAGIESYAPTAVSSYIYGEQTPTTTTNNTTATSRAPVVDSSSSSSSDSDSDSFASASEMRRRSITEDPSHAANGSSEVLSPASTLSMDTQRVNKSAAQNEKEIQKLAKQREKLDRKLAQKRESEEEKLRKAKEAEKGEEGKAQERYEKEVRKQEEKHRKEMEKLEAKKAKEAEKVEKKRRKRLEGEQLGKVARERDEFRGQAELLRREVEILHEQLGDLQRENTAMASRLGKLGGPDVLQSVKNEAGTSSRAGSMEISRKGSAGHTKDAPAV